MHSEPTADAGAALDACRARGDHRHDPVRFRFIEALARRAATHGGEARRLLDARVATLLAAYGEALATAHGSEGAVASAAVPTPKAPRGLLGELVDQVARQASPADGAAARDAELKTLSYFRSTWSRLSADRRLTQSLAKVPENAGPLNSHHLVHRSLKLMRELSPEYLHRFMAYVDALSWLDQAQGASAPAAPAESPRPEGQKKGARGKSR